MKQNFRIKAFLVVILFSIPFAAVSESPDLAVHMRIIENDVELSNPSMWVKEGAEASMSITGDGENALAIGLVVSSLEDDEVHVLAELETSENQISPELIFKKGEWASVSVGELEFHLLVEDYKWPAARRLSGVLQSCRLFRSLDGVGRT